MNTKERSQLVMERQEFFNINAVKSHIYLWIGQTNCHCEKVTRTSFNTRLPSGMRFSVDGSSASYELYHNKVIGL